MRPFRQLVQRALGRALERVAPSDARAMLRLLRAPESPAFPKQGVVVAPDPPRCRVLVLAPHPDDEAIGPGGTLVAHVENGSAVTLCYLTDGGGVAEGRERLVAVRREEARAAGESLAAAGPGEVRQVFWEHPDTRLTNDEPTVAAMAALLQDERPERVYLPSFFDHHYDHFATTQVFVDAVARSGWRGEACGYEVWDPVAFPNYVVDVSARVARRDEVLACYATPHATTDFTKLCRYRSSVHYTLHVNSHRDRADRGYAEAFLRLDAEPWCALQRGFAEALRAGGSALPSHVR